MASPASIVGLLINVEQLVEWELNKKTDMLWENPHQYYFAHRKTHMTALVSNQGYHYGKPELWHGLFNCAVDVG
jgi:hypothetical protein